MSVSESSTISLEPFQATDKCTSKKHVCRNALIYHLSYNKATQSKTFLKACLKLDLQYNGIPRGQLVIEQRPTSGELLVYTLF